MDIKKIVNVITINAYKIRFEYKTKKGYRREQQRVIYDVTNLNAIDNFYSWAKNIRTMFNVEILSVVELTEKKKEIEI